MQGKTPKTEVTKKQAEQIRQILLETESRILSKAKDGLELSMNRDLETPGDSIDESSDEELLSTELRLRDREKKLLGKIRYALKRLEEGVINECEDCGEPIGFNRLLVRPVTTLCVQCKEKREASERMMATPTAVNPTITGASNDDRHDG